MGRSLDRRLHLRKRMAKLPHEKGSLPGTDQRVPRSGQRQEAREDRRESCGYLRQRHDDDRGRGGERKEMMAGMLPLSRRDYVT